MHCQAQPPTIRHTRLTQWGKGPEDIWFHSWCQFADTAYSFLTVFKHLLDKFKDKGTSEEYSSPSHLQLLTVWVKCQWYWPFTMGAFIAKMLLPTVSSLVFLPTASVAAKRGFHMEAMVYFFTMFFTAVRIHSWLWFDVRDWDCRICFLYLSLLFYSKEVRFWSSCILNQFKLVFYTFK